MIAAQIPTPLTALRGDTPRLMILIAIWILVAAALYRLYLPPRPTRRAQRDGQIEMFDYWLAGIAIVLAILFAGSLLLTTYLEDRRGTDSDPCDDRGNNDPPTPKQ